MAPPLTPDPPWLPPGQQGGTPPARRWEMGCMGRPLTPLNPRVPHRATDHGMGRIRGWLPVLQLAPLLLVLVQLVLLLLVLLLVPVLLLL